KLLVANRGEIALRIMRTAKKMGIQTVAVYSEVDKDAPHVSFADQAVCIGPAASSESYLKGDTIIEVAKELGADAIHPGYGFLSENASFAELVEKNNLIFIGPKAHAIEVMGNKLASKESLEGRDIPMVPGTKDAIENPKEAIRIANEIGYPVLIKAAAGGGGKGMRVVNKESEVEEQMDRAISEAVSAFGDGSVFIEKFIGNPRHIEVQILADTHGNVLHLFERECSVQRRHQKVLEEAPSVAVNEDLRARMGKAAVEVAIACDYVGAGTVEFLLDSDEKFYFLEMNTRLQVEHPITEMITNLDLVEEQIRIAQGEKLSFAQEDLKIDGHAIELRVYAEDPYDNFSPSIGTLSKYEVPTGDGVRVDDGIVEGSEIPIYYDPMLAKLIVHASTREEALTKMLSAIADYRIEGIQTTLSFGDFVCRHDAFVSGNFTTHFVEQYFNEEAREKVQQEEAEIAARIALGLHLEAAVKLRLPKNE
ncbi:MAG TPA: acetyl-CoA carboxylase biotin carboxylase subunit, partial [Flavobacteriaceae bacterium]|nr:acetyl-CoA carboxylase biotin carboxylase subunit [Flavobacteriaceae bacterium]